MNYQDDEEHVYGGCPCCEGPLDEHGGCDTCNPATTPDDLEVRASFEIRAGVVSVFEPAPVEVEETNIARMMRFEREHPVQARNVYEELGRTKKVLAIAAVLPATETPDESAALAASLAALSDDSRKVIARHAGVNTPSDRTWGAVVEYVRSRRVA